MVPRVEFACSAIILIHTHTYILKYRDFQLLYFILGHIKQVIVIMGQIHFYNNIFY